MGVKWKSGAPDWARKMRDARRHLLADAQVAVGVVEGETQALVKLGVNMGVYYTEPGLFYERTHELFEGISVVSELMGGVLRVQVVNPVPYASDVDVGDGKRQQPVSSLVQQALQLGSNFAPLYLGRTGRNYNAPNPAHIRGMVFASERLKEEFNKSVQKRLVFERR